MTKQRSDDSRYWQFGSPWRWFLRGMAVGMLLMASVNALSYFIRSESYENLVGATTRSDEAIGFPFVVWETGNMYGGYFADYPKIGLNMLIAAIISLPLGLIAARKAAVLNQLLWNDFGYDAAEGVHDETSGPTPIQFSLQSLMIATFVAAIFATIASRFAARRETLIAIYALGPTFLVFLAMLPRRLSWQQRVKILAPSAITLIAVAIAVGIALKIEFDKILMGIFLCWTPQSVVAAIGLLAIIYVKLTRVHRL